MIVTNIEGHLKTGEPKKGFYMDGYLASNLLGIKGYLRKEWDVVGIVSGHGKVRIGKSVLAFQIGSYVAWILAGGWIDMESKPKGSKTTWEIKKITQPKRPIRFSLEENVVFSALDLQKRAAYLYNKYGKNQILIYDEGRQGLEAKRAMENLNKTMEDFLQECGFMGHVTLIVLPDFFKLHADYAVSRSLFLVDAFADKHKQRGFFNFYDETQKEWLYFLGKKKLGVVNRYNSASETFWGRFSSWFPFDKEKYEKMKQESIKKKQRSRQQLNWKRQRDVLIYLYKEATGKNDDQIAEDVTIISGFKLSGMAVAKTLQRLKKDWNP